MSKRGDGALTARYAALPLVNAMSSTSFPAASTSLMTPPGFEPLKLVGLTGVQLVISDAHMGLREATAQ